MYILTNEAFKEDKNRKKPYAISNWKYFWLSKSNKKLYISLKESMKRVKKEKEALEKEIKDYSRPVKPSISPKSPGYSKSREISRQNIRSNRHVQNRSGDEQGWIPPSIDYGDSPSPQADTPSFGGFSGGSGGGSGSSGSWGDSGDSGSSGGDSGGGGGD